MTEKISSQEGNRDWSQLKVFGSELDEPWLTVGGNQTVTRGGGGYGAGNTETFLK